MQSLVCSPFATPPQPSEYLSAVFPRPLVWPLSVVGWVYTFPGPFCLPCRRMWDSFLVDHLDALWVSFVLGGMRVDLTFPIFPSWLLCRPCTSIPAGFFLGLGLFPQPYARAGSFSVLAMFPQPRVGVFPGSSLKGFTFGRVLVPQPIAAPSPSSPRSLVSCS